MPTTATESATTTTGQAPRAEQPTAEPVTGYQRTCPGQADQVCQVRRDVARYLGDSPITADAVLVASEIATNAILHSRSREGAFTIRVELYRDHCRSCGTVLPYTSASWAMTTTVCACALAHASIDSPWRSIEVLASVSCDKRRTSRTRPIPLPPLR